MLFSAYYLSSNLGVFVLSKFYLHIERQSHLHKSLEVNVNNRNIKLQS